MNAGILLQATGVSCGYPGRTVAHDVSLSLCAGEFLCLLGPNGCGKTTLFRTMLGFLRLEAGTILVNGQDLRSLSLRDIARTVGYVPQSHVPPFPYRVLDMVAMGRTAHLGFLGIPGRKDFAIASALLERLEIAHLAERPCTEISDGERQMCLVARALAQEPRLLVMDEPTASLDFGNQVRVLECLRSLVAEGLGVAMTTHLPDHAFLCADRVALMKDGKILSEGLPEEVVTEAALRHVYGVDVRVAEVEIDGIPVRTCIPQLSPCEDPSVVSSLWQVA